MAQWAEVWGVEPGDAAPQLLLKFPLRLWGDELEQEVRATLARQGVADVTVRRTTDELPAPVCPAQAPGATAAGGGG